MASGTAKQSTSPDRTAIARRRLRPDGRLPTRDEIRHMSEALGRIADEGRLRILFLLDQAPRNVGALGAALGEDRHSLSHHLRILRVSGLILATRDGRRVEYSLTELGRAGVRAARTTSD
jgi:ArsR family transcriptional regulator